jgi:sugar (pentulose or hexulose) kinase
LRASGSCPARFVATGGLAYAPHLTSRLSEVMATPVEVDPGPHKTAVGAALLARDGR